MIYRGSCYTVVRKCFCSYGLMLLIAQSYILQPSGLLAQQGRADPGWDDPFFRDYLARTNADAASGTTGIVFSIPVLGFTENAAGGDGSLSALNSTLSRTVQAWPRCATIQPPTRTIVPQQVDQAAGSAPGSWFVATYEFGCLQVVIEGDQKSSSDDVIERAGGLPESGAISIFRHDENAGQKLDQDGRPVSGDHHAEVQGEPQATYTRGNLTYTITVSCAVEAASFCANDNSVTSLIRELKPVAGQPE